MANNRKNIFLVGAAGMLARMVIQRAPSGYDITGVDLPDFDLTDRDQVLTLVAEDSPDLIINCAAYTDVDGCESNKELAMRVNGTGVGHLAEAARINNAILVHISTDYVFSGENDSPYREETQTDPQSAYGLSKLMGEQAILDSGLSDYYIVRTSWLYGPGGKNFVETMLRLAAEREQLRVVSDQVGAPTFTADLADAIFHLIDKKAPFGIYHFSNSGRCSWHRFAEEIIALAKVRGLEVKAESIEPITTDEFPLPAKRPAYSVLSNNKYKTATGVTPPEWEDGLCRYFDIRID